MITTHIQELAKRRGIENGTQLARAMGVADNVGARLWSQDFERIDKITLNRLCRTLRCQPGQVFKYTPDEE